MQAAHQNACEMAVPPINDIKSILNQEDKAYIYQQVAELYAKNG
jgi:glutathione synthase/RimK-type ligase-like ATP-grasp enzyme